MKSFPLKRQIFVLTAGIGVMIVLIIGLIIVPSVKRIIELKKNISDTHVLMEGQYQKVKQLRRSLRELKNVQTEVKEYAQSNLSPGQELSVITSLEALATKHNIKQTLHVALSDNPAGPVSLPFYTFSFLNQGSWQHQLAYLKAMEELPYYLIIDSLQWEKSARGNASDNMLTLRFDARVYVSK